MPLTVFLKVHTLKHFLSLKKIFQIGKKAQKHIFKPEKGKLGSNNSRKGIIFSFIAEVHELRDEKQLKWKLNATQMDTYSFSQT